MNLIKPKKLKAGDTIGILALSGDVEKAKILKAKKYFEDKGYKIVLSENIFDRYRYLAGTDEKKVQELHRFFADPEIKMILCARGGYGAIRLLDKIDFDLIKNNPKIFAGYSDITAFEAMMYKKAGLVTFYSPVAQADFGIDKVSKLVETSFFKVLTNTKELQVSADKRKMKIYHQGEAKGVLWGGNLATVATMCGLDFIPDEKFIFFAEDIDEDTYEIDRLFYQLLNIKKFRENLQAIVLGDFIGVKNKKHFDELFFEIGERIQKPILSGFKIGHGKEKITLPYGANAEISTSTKILKIEKYLV